MVAWSAIRTDKNSAHAAAWLSRSQPYSHLMRSRGVTYGFPDRTRPRLRRRPPCRVLRRLQGFPARVVSLAAVRSRTGVRLRYYAGPRRPACLGWTVAVHHLSLGLRAVPHRDRILEAVRPCRAT